MILNNNFDKAIQQNFLRGTREYDLASFFWDKAERAMQGKPTQEPVLTKPKLKELLESTKALQDYFTEIQWVKPKLEQQEPKPEFTRGEIQSLIAAQRERINEIQTEIEYCKYRIKRITNYLSNLLDTPYQVSAAVLQSMPDRVRELSNNLTVQKVKMHKAVKLQRKLKKMLA
jgi:hypothetical protein